MNRHILDRNRRDAALLVAGCCVVLVLAGNGLYLERNGTFGYEPPASQDDLSPLRDSLDRLREEREALNSEVLKLASDTLKFRDQVIELEQTIPELKEQIKDLDNKIFQLSLKN